MTHLTQDFIKEMEQKLQEEKVRLTADLVGLAEHTDVGDDEDENATEVEFDDLNRELRARIEGDLAKIEIALGKIADGTYGTDAEGQEITEARLRAIPWADKAI